MMSGFTRRAGFLCLLLLCLNGLPAQESSTPEETPQREWDLTLNGGFTINSGNTRNRLFNGEVGYSLHLDNFELDTDFDALYGRSGAEVIQNRGKWSNAFTRRLSRRLNLFGQVVLEYDEMAGIDTRTTAGMGVRVDIHDRDDLKTSLTASLNGEFLNSGEGNLDSATLRLHVTLAWEAHFSDHAQAKARLLYTPDLSDMGRDYRIELNAALSLMMTDPLWLTLKLSDHFNNLPLSGTVRKNDLTLITAVELRF